MGEIMSNQNIEKIYNSNLLESLIRKAAFFENHTLIGNTEELFISITFIGQKKFKCKLIENIDCSYRNDDYMFFGNDYKVISTKIISVAEVNKIKFL
jgi:hypothetical protein